MTEEVLDDFKALARCDGVAVEANPGGDLIAWDDAVVVPCRLALPVSDIGLDAWGEPHWMLIDDANAALFARWGGGKSAQWQGYLATSIRIPDFWTFQGNKAARIGYSLNRLLVAGPDDYDGGRLKP